MTGRAEIQYIRFNVDGNAARKITVVPPVEFAPIPVRKYRRKRIYVDPVAIMGMVVAVAMFISMGVGLLQYRNDQESLAQMENYVLALQAENNRLEKAYEDSYNLAEVERTALALGMIPRDQAQTVSLSMGE